MLQTAFDPSKSQIVPDPAGPRIETGAVAGEAPVLVRYWAIVNRWKWVIASIIAACLVAGLVATLLMTPQYTATSRIEISREQKKITNVEGIESEDAGRDIEFYQTQYSLLEARSLAERVARALNLASNDAFFTAHGENPDESSLFSRSTQRRLTPAERAAREQLAIKLLRTHVAISPIRGSRLVDISYTSSDPHISQLIANSWTEQFIQSSMDRRFASTADARRFLETRLADLRSRLERSERDLVGYAAQKGIVTLSKTEGPDGITQSERTLVQDDLQALNMALAKARTDRVAAESAARTAGAQGANAEALANSAIAAMREKRAEAAAEYAKLMVQYEPGYPAAEALQRQVQALDASIAREESRVRGGITSQYQEALQREQALQARLDALKDRFGTQQRDSIQYNIYQREADTNRQLYDGLLQRYKEIGVAGVGANNIAIIDSAKVPEKPSSPNLLLNLIAALFAGVLLAGAATFILEQIDEGLRDPAQVNKALGVPLLGSVPDVEDEDAIELLRDPKSFISEAYLTIRSNLAFSTDHGVPRSLMVTSTREAEGKSTTSVALATMLTRTGKKTLIVDADMRSASVHTYLGGTNQEGLSNLLAGASDWQRVIQPTQIPHLSLLSAGPVPPSAAELLSSDRLMMLLKQMLEHFDHIVLDAPPILGLADAPLISRSVEGSVFVVEAEGVAVRGLRAALARLTSVHAHIFGAVLTKLKRRQVGYGYGYGYGYGFSYGQEKEQ